jgi:hypothetical protein
MTLLASYFDIHRKDAENAKVFNKILSVLCDFAVHLFAWLLNASNFNQI